MIDINNIFKHITQHDPANIFEINDYVDEQGLLCCGKCNTRKQKEISLPLRPSEKIRVYHMCKCGGEEHERKREKERQKEFRAEVERIRKTGITDPNYLRQTFSNDDNRNSKTTAICRTYVEKWTQMKADNIGMLFYGGVGTGKSFLSCCIANALIDKGIRTVVTNFPRILNKLQGFDEDKQAFLDDLNRYDMLVIDDLGAERDTAYSTEQVFNIIDARYRTGKPLIITTNLTIAELKNPPSLAYARIYDRILEMCPIQIRLNGESGRTAKIKDKQDKARKILEL